MNEKCRHGAMCDADYNARVRAYRAAHDAAQPQATAVDYEAENARLRVQVDALMHLLDRRERGTSTASAMLVLARRLGLDPAATYEQVIGAVTKALDHADRVSELARAAVAADMDSRRATVRLRSLLARGPR